MNPSDVRSLTEQGDGQDLETVRRIRDYIDARVQRLVAELAAD